MAGKGRGKGRGRRAKRDGGEVSDYRRKVRARKLAKSNKGSCAPKLFMLLPFAAVGTFLVLKS